MAQGTKLKLKSKLDVMTKKQVISLPILSALRSAAAPQGLKETSNGKPYSVVNAIFARRKAPPNAWQSRSVRPNNISDFDGKKGRASDRIVKSEGRMARESNEIDHRSDPHWFATTRWS